MRVALFCASSWLPACPRQVRVHKSHAFWGTEQWAFVVQVTPAAAFVKGGCNASDPGCHQPQMVDSLPATGRHIFWGQFGARWLPTHLWAHLRCARLTVCHYFAISVPQKHPTCFMADRLQTEPLGWGWFFTPPNFNSDGLSVDLPHATCLLSLSLLLDDTTPAVASHACIVPVEHGEQWPNCSQEFLKPLANGVFIC